MLSVNVEMFHLVLKNTNIGRQALQLVYQDDVAFAPGVYVMKSVSQDDCRHWSTNDSIPFSEHLAVAKLIGTEIRSTSPLGSVSAVSSKNTRVAIADWDCVRIWSVQPSAFLHKNVGSRPAQQDADKRAKGCFKPLKVEEADGLSDMAYTSRCGHGYYHSYIKVKGKKERRIVALQPTELPRQGVVYSMQFMSDDRLWAWTDRGLVSWNWGPGRSGERSEDMLPMVEPGTWC